MINKVDHLIVAVKDIEEAENNFSKLFGAVPVWTGEHPEIEFLIRERALQDWYLGLIDLI